MAIKYLCGGPSGVALGRDHDDKVGFYGSRPVSKPVVDRASLDSVVDALEALGLVIVVEERKPPEEAKTVDLLPRDSRFLAEPEPPKRRPGRPRGSKNRPKDG